MNLKEDDLREASFSFREIGNRTNRNPTTVMNAQNRRKVSIEYRRGTDVVQYRQPDFWLTSG